MSVADLAATFVSLRHKVCLRSASTFRPTPSRWPSKSGSIVLQRSVFERLGPPGGRIRLRAVLWPGQRRPLVSVRLLLSISALRKEDIGEHSTGGATFWMGAVVGWSVIIVGIRMGLHDREHKPGLLLKWVVGGLPIHDLVWLHGVAVTGVLATVVLRYRMPAVIAWAAATTIVMTFAWPFVRGYGRRSDHPSALPRNYAHGLLAYIAVMWVIAIVVFGLSQVRHNRPALEE